MALDGLQKLKALSVNATSKISIYSKESKFFIATAECAFGNCTVEGKIMMEDAQVSFNEAFQDFLKKFKRFRINTLAPARASAPKKN